MLKHSATRTYETRTRATSGARAITTIVAVAAATLGLGVLLTLSSNIWLPGLGLMLIAGTLGVAVPAASKALADARVRR